MILTRTFCILSIALFAASDSWAGQLIGGDFETLYEVPDLGTSGMGNALSGAGDVNGDGFADVIFGADWADPGGRWNAGSAYVLSGLDGSQLFQFDGAAGHDRLGNSVSGAGDVDGDGMDDLIVGAWTADPNGFQNAGSAYVYSGASGALLHRFDGESDYAWLGSAVSGAGDVNADGYADLLVGSYGANPNGRFRSGSVFVYCGLTGAELYRFDGDLAGDELGRVVADAGDINADGYPDLLLGSPAAATLGNIWQGTVFVKSGLDGSTLHHFFGYRSYSRYATSISGVGDMDQDGFDDFVVGEPRRTVPHWWEDIEGAGMAFVYSGATGAEIHRFEGNEEGGWLGYSVSGIGDVDGDGVVDCLLGGAFVSVGPVEIRSGATGKVLKEFFGYGVRGFVVSNAGDVDSDGHPDLVLGSGDTSFYGNPVDGGVKVIRLAPYLYADAKEISLMHGASLNLVVDFPIGAASLDYKILFSTEGPGPTLYGADIPLSRGSLVKATYFGSYPFLAHQGLQGTLDANGSATASFTVQGGLPARLLGRSLWMAAVSGYSGVEPNRSSIAIRLRFVP